MKSVLDPTFRYVPSAQTDIRKTFARVRSELRQRTASPALDPARLNGLPPSNLMHLYPDRKRTA